MKFAIHYMLPLLPLLDIGEHAMTITGHDNFLQRESSQVEKWFARYTKILAVDSLARDIIKAT